MKEYKIIEGNCIEGMKQIPDGLLIHPLDKEFEFCSCKS